MPDRSFDNHRRGLCLITAAILAWPAMTFAQTALLWPEHCLSKVLRTAKPPAAINPLKAAGARD